MRGIVRVALCALVLGGCVPAWAGAAGCSAREIQVASLRPTDPAASDAARLATLLSKHGFTIQCILRSKMANLFPDQKGAALFRTNYGDFEALFLAADHTFDDIVITCSTEHAEGANGYTYDGYRYEFKDRTGKWRRLSQGRQQFFVKRGNMLLMTMYNPLVPWLERAVSSSD
jgi:hypothetical protein